MRRRRRRMHGNYPPSPSSSRLLISRGGATHFQRKVETKVELLLARASPSPAPPAKKTAVVLRKRRTSGQVNADWQNKKQYMADTGKRYNKAMKEATKMFVQLSMGKLEGKTQQQIVADLNIKWSLDGEGREGVREKHILNVRTVFRAVQSGTIGTTPKKKGRAARISRDFFALIAKHLNMEQIGARGEMDVAAIKATMTAATLGTVHEVSFNNKYAWEKVRELHAEELVPTGLVMSEDIRWQWVTFEKMVDFYVIHKVSKSRFYVCSPSDLQPIVVPFLERESQVWLCH